MMDRAGLMGLAVAAAMQSSAAAAEAPQSASLECQVLEAAANGLWREETVEASSPGDGGFLAEQLPHVAKSLELSDAEVAVVQARARADTAPYRGPCWGALGPPKFEFAKRAAFTRPIFLDVETAVFQMRRDEHDRGGAWICSVRRDGATWRANCQQTLIWAR